jgi:hypothetical protein
VFIRKRTQKPNEAFTNALIISALFQLQRQPSLPFNSAARLEPIEQLRESSRRKMETQITWQKLRPLSSNYQLRNLKGTKHEMAESRLQLLAADCSFVAEPTMLGGSADPTA